MNVKKYIAAILILIFVLSSIASSINADEIKQLDISNYKFSQEIFIPFDTSSEQSKYKPIDTEIIFENTCYAKDEKDNSVRIGCDIGSELLELESQIYNLKKTDDTHISSCSVVFLIPKEADGNEKYYVYYDSEKKDTVDYEKHLEITDSHYFYEPISGQKIDIDYYGIKENDNFVYSVVQKGELLGNPIALSVLKFKPETKIVETYNIDQLAVFDMRYGINTQPGYIGTSWAENVKKTVLVEGNLMVRVRLECKSPKGNILSDNIYTYYYSPSENKKIVVDCYHEILEDINVEEPSMVDGTYGGIVSIKSRSSTIEKMNVGSILPELYVFNEDETINDFSVPQNPSTVEREPIVSTEDDIDLGSAAWVCSNDPEKGLTHGLILDSNKGFTDDDYDGVQVKAWVKENIKLPGLEADTGNLYAARNSYENKEHTPNLKKGFTVNYKIVFFTLVNEEIETINEYSDIFQKTAPIIPSLRENITIKDEEEKIERFTLTTFVHMAPSFPLGSLLSAAVGKKLPYIYAELYKENEFKSSGSVSRLALGSVDLDLEGKSLIETIKTVLGIFDFKNSSIFKKIVFPDIEKGTYVVKIFRENTIFSEERKYIGYGILEVNKNSTLRIRCTAESKASFNIEDQEENGVENVGFYLLKEGNIISDGKTDVNGSINLKAPANLRNKYILRVLYKGFLVSEEKIKLGYFNHFRPFSKDFKINLYDLKIILKDKWGFIPEVDVNLFLTSDEMFEKITINSEKIDRENYIFRNLPEADYSLTLKYKSFEVEDKITIDSDKTVEMVFPAEYKTDLNILNLIGQSVTTGRIIISRNNKEIEAEIDEKGKSFLTVPPGAYYSEVFIDGEKVAYQNIDIKSSKTLDIVTDTGSLLHMALTIIAIIGLIISAVYLFYKKKYSFAIKAVIIFLLIIAIFQPWWVLNGETGNIKTNTSTMLYPPKMVSFTESPDGMGGSISMLPAELVTLLSLLSVLLIVSTVLILLSVLSKNRFKKTSLALMILSIILIVLILGLFYYALSLVTELGVGSFMGKGEVMTTVPGMQETIPVESSWGPGIGFYITVFALILVFANFIYKKIKPRFK